MVEKQEEYSIYLLEWYSNIYLNWKRVKPRYSKIFDLKSLEEWEESCLKLKEKLLSNSKEDFENYQEAASLYERWELLYREAHAHLLGRIEV